MNLRINFQYIYIIIFTCFFFLWGVDIDIAFLKSNYLSNFRLSYLIIFLIIPIIYKVIKSNFSSFKKIFYYRQHIIFFRQIFNNQQYLIFFIFFIVVHFFLVNIYYNEIISKYEIANLLYFVLLSIIYCHYRNFILVNFKNILTLYLIIFVSYSIYEGSQMYNPGQCNNDLLIIDLIRKYSYINFTNSIYLENSHLAMMSIAVFFSSAFILIKEKKRDFLFLVLFSIEVIIVLNNLSTTYFIAYFCSQIALLLFFLKKINIKYWIITLFILLINSYLFFSDKDCMSKVTELNIGNVVKSVHVKHETNLTTFIYQRSMIVAKETLINRSLGWGVDGMDNATLDHLDNYKDPAYSGFHNMKIFLEMESTYWLLNNLNLKDGLSNLFKMLTEFGIFTFIIFFYFIKYIVNLKDLSAYNLFIIILFITMSIRGVGYFNGGFIFCILELFYHKKFMSLIKIKKNQSN